MWWSEQASLYGLGYVTTLEIIMCVFNSAEGRQATPVFYLGFLSEEKPSSRPRESFSDFPPAVMGMLRARGTGGGTGLKSL